MNNDEFIERLLMIKAHLQGALNEYSRLEATGCSETCLSFGIDLKEMISQATALTARIQEALTIMGIEEQHVL